MQSFLYLIRSPFISIKRITDDIIEIERRLRETYKNWENNF